MMYKGIKEGRRRWDLNGCSGRILCGIRAPKKTNAETLLISSLQAVERLWLSGGEDRKNLTGGVTLACYRAFRHAVSLARDVCGQWRGFSLSSRHRSRQLEFIGVELALLSPSPQTHALAGSAQPCLDVPRLVVKVCVSCASDERRDVEVCRPARWSCPLPNAAL
jgi:hypothetical protein